MVTSHQGDQAEPDDDVSASAHTENVASNVNDRPEPEHAEATTSEGTPPPDSVPDGDGASWKDQTLRESWLKVAEERIKQVSDPKSAYRHGADLLDGSPTNTFVLVIFGVSLGWLSLKYAPVSYTHLRAHETVLDLVCRLLLEKKNTTYTVIHI